MPGERNLNSLLSNLKPKLNGNKWAFVTIKEPDINLYHHAVATIKETEGVTLVVSTSIAEKLQLEYQYAAAWITLEVHSALEAVGLTAIVASALADHGISCNVIAGYYHDHLFVAYNEASQAMRVLREIG